jgi:nicotinamidase-related amidase
MLRPPTSRNVKTPSARRSGRRGDRPQTRRTDRVSTPQDGAVEALIVLDVVSDFTHADGDRLLDSLRAHATTLQAACTHARRRGIPVIYVNDAHDRWDGEHSAHVAQALAAAGGDVVARIAPETGDRYLFKGEYSAFDGTALRRLLEAYGVTRIVLVGAATEMCVAQTAITARALGLQVTVLEDACATVDPGDESIALAYLTRVTGSVVTSLACWCAA